MFLKKNIKKINSYILFKLKFNENKEKIIEIVKKDNHYIKLLKNLEDKEIEKIILSWAKAIYYNRKYYYHMNVNVPYHLEKILEDFL